MKTIYGAPAHQRARAPLDYARGKPEKGAVLIIALWILAMLVLLAISIGRRTSIELRLLKYHLSRVQAFHLARAAIERIYAEKNMDNNNYDSLNEAWSNKLKADGEPLFKDFPLGNGTFTLKYTQEETKLYGMQDENAKLNINKIINDKSELNKNRKEEFINLIKKVLPEKDAQAQEMAEKFIDWIDNADNQSETFSHGEIQAKNAPLDRLEELTMIDGFSIEDANELSSYLTVYGDGSININTASQEVLSSLCCDKNDKALGDEAAGKIIKYRSGENEIIKPIESVDDLINQDKSGISFSEEEKGILKSRDVQSSCYKANSSAEVNGVKKEISAVINFTKDAAPQYLYWHED